MLIQALLLIAVIVLVSGSIMTSTLVTAKTALSHSVITESQAAMSDAMVDFVAWAQSRVQRANSHTSWSAQITNGKSDTIVFKRSCRQALPPSNSSSACQHATLASWQVTGATGGTDSAAIPRSNYSSSLAKNMSLPVDEQRISAILSVDLDSPDGRLTFASLSRQITARVIDVYPFVIVTAMRDVSSSSGSIMTGQGDSAGQPGNYSRRPEQTPDPHRPEQFLETRISATVNCSNSADVDPRNPMTGKASGLIEEGRDGDMDWHYESICVPQFNTPAPPGDKNYVAPIGTTYASVEGDQSQAWRGDRKAFMFPR